MRCTHTRTGTHKILKDNEKSVKIKRDMIYRRDHKIAQTTDLSRVLLLVLTCCVTGGELHVAGGVVSCGGLVVTNLGTGCCTT